MFEWNDKATLVIIRPDCFVDIYDGANLTNSHRYLGGETNEHNRYELSWYSFANRTSSYVCDCIN